MFKKIVFILICFPIIIQAQKISHPKFLFKLLNTEDPQSFLEERGWEINSANKAYENFEYEAVEFYHYEMKFSKGDKYSPNRSNYYSLTIIDYPGYPNEIILKLYNKRFFNDFKNIIESSYKEISKDIKNNTIEVVYIRRPLAVHLTEKLDQYYLIKLCNGLSLLDRQERLKEMGNTEVDNDDEGYYEEVYIEDELEIEDTEADEDIIIEIEEEDDEEFFMVVENMPEFPGGDLGLMKYIQKNVKYPPIAKEYNITGKVYVSFIVDKSGNVTNVKVIRGVDKNLDAEAVRVVKSLPKYKPGKKRGKPVRVMFTIPINFKLD